jgi:hypothetical protein
MPFKEENIPNTNNSIKRDTVEEEFEEPLCAIKRTTDILFLLLKGTNKNQTLIIDFTNDCSFISLKNRREKMYEMLMKFGEVSG